MPDNGWSWQYSTELLKIKSCLTPTYERALVMLSSYLIFTDGQPGSTFPSFVFYRCQGEQQTPILCFLHRKYPQK